MPYYGYCSDCCVSSAIIKMCYICLKLTLIASINLDEFTRIANKNLYKTLKLETPTMTNAKIAKISSRR